METPATTEDSAYGHSEGATFGDWRNLARKYAVQPQDIEDLLQEAAVAEIEARRSFNPAKGASMRTYTYRKVLGAMQHYLRDRAFTVRLPGWRWQQGEQPPVTCGLEAVLEKGASFDTDLMGNLAAEDILDLFHGKARDVMRLVSLGWSLDGACRQVYPGAKTSVSRIALRRAKRTIQAWRNEA